MFLKLHILKTKTQYHFNNVPLFILFIYLFISIDASYILGRNDSYNKLGKTEIKAANDNSKGICKKLKLRYSSDSNNAVNIKALCEFNCIY